jgi:hypothetical protein
MMRCDSARFPVLAGILAVFCVQPAFAQDRSCSPMTIDADPSVGVRWPGLLNHVRETFEARVDVDRCAHVTLTAREASITVEVVLPDGRSATRSASRREDVVPTLVALLLLPQRSPQVLTSSPAEPTGSNPPPANPMPAPSSASPPGTPDVSLSRGLAVPERDALVPTLGQPRSHLRIELSAATGARIGDGQASVGVGAISFLELAGWLVGFEGRADRYQTLAGGAHSGGALELAVLGGRRFRFQSIALDLTAGPAAVMQGTATFETRSPTTGNDVSQSSSSTVPRLLLGARVSFSALSTVHTFVGIDGELGPTRAGDDVPGAPRLPLWTLGLALGATVGTQ